MTAPTYRIERIQDLLAVPPERRETCLRELLYALSLLELAAGEECEPVAEAIVWTDDGYASAELTINGDVALRLEVTEGAAGG